MSEPSLPPEVATQIARIRAEGEASAARVRADVEARGAAELAAFQAREHRRDRIYAAIGVMAAVLIVGGGGFYGELSARDARIAALTHEVQLLRERAAEIQALAETRRHEVDRAHDAIAELEASAVVPAAPPAEAPTSDDARPPAMRSRQPTWRRPIQKTPARATPEAAPCAPGDPLCASDLDL